MADDFSTLILFLERMGAEAGGRSQPVPTGELREKIKRLVEGKCSNAEKDQICEDVRDHPAYLQWMAECMKAKRTQRKVGAG